MVEHWTWHEHSGDLAIAEMNRAGVDKAFLVGHGDQSTKPYDRRFFAKYRDRFFWFPQIPDPMNEDCLDIIKKEFEEGASGLKAFPAIMAINLTDPKFLSVLELARKNRKRIMICLADSTEKSPSTETYLNQLDSEILPTFSGINFQINHGASIDPLSARAELLFKVGRSHDNMYLNTSFLGFIASNKSFSDDEHEYPFPNQLRRLKKLYEEIGIEKLLFGSDWPWPEKFRKYVQDVDSIRRHADFMSNRDKELFLGDNALRFLKES
jgi:predicted TIM-barrel fold metal-dependent hydrolase